MENASSQPASGSSPAPIPVVKKASLTKVLPSDRLALDRQFDALKAFTAEYEANGGKPVTNIKAGEISKMSGATIVVTNAFFCEMGLLTRGEDGFIPSPEAIAYLRAVNGLSPETATEKLRPLFEKQWFYQILSPRLRLRPMEATEVVKVLGEESNAGKEHIPRLGMLIDFIHHVGIIKKEGNQITLATATNTLPAPPAPPQGGGGSSNTVTPPEGFNALPIPLDVRTGRTANLHFPKDLKNEEVGKLIAFIKLSFDYTEPSRATVAPGKEEESIF